MEKIDHASMELRQMDELAALRSPVHLLHPAAKLAVTIAYILTVMSFSKYNFSGLMVMVLLPVVLYQAAGISVGTCFYKLRFVLPLSCAVGLFNPFFDHTPLLMVGPVLVTGGMVSMVTLMMKGGFCLMASFLLAATTSIDSLCAALRKLRLPGLFTTLLLLTYRYIAVMMDEVSVMTTAYQLRAPGQKGIHYKAWGSFLGQLLLRSMDRAQELYESMQLRGFQGEFFYAEPPKARFADVLFVMGGLGLLLVMRFVNLSVLLGSFAIGGLS